MFLGRLFGTAGKEFTPEQQPQLARLVGLQSFKFVCTSISSVACLGEIFTLEQQPRLARWVWLHDHTLRIGCMIFIA